MQEREVVPAHAVKFMIEYMIKVGAVEKARKRGALQ